MTSDATWLEWMKLGASNFSAGKFSEAINFFQKAVDCDPARAQGWANLSSALATQHRLSSALDAIERAIILNPGIMGCHMIKGDILRDLKNPEAALDAYAKAVSLQRDPHSLNRLAWAMRALYRFQEAEELYKEAIKLDPGFNLAKINLASLSLIMGKLDACSSLLKAIDTRTFSKPEYIEYSAMVALYKEYMRHAEPLKLFATEGNKAPLLHELKKPRDSDQIDHSMLDRIKGYSETINRLPTEPGEKKLQLPSDWDVIEALFMIPYINTPQEYPAAISDLQDFNHATPGLLETKNMIDAIRSARSQSINMADPVVAEVNLRCWHSIASKDVPGFMPGHFKYSQNRVVGTQDIERVHPLKTSATLRAFITDIYRHMPQGMPRALISLMAVCDMHPFADGNARVAFIWLNRELENAGLMPALFSRDLSLKGDLGNAMTQVRHNPSDFTPLVNAINKAQIFARSFCDQVSQR